MLAKGGMSEHKHALKLRYLWLQGWTHGRWRQEINYPPGASWAKGGEIPEEDMARGHDTYACGEYDEENEDLHPDIRTGNTRSEDEMLRQHRLGFHAQNYEDLPQPEEPQV